MTRDLGCGLPYVHLEDPPIPFFADWANRSIRPAGELKDVYKDIGSSVGKEKVDREVTSRYAGFGLGFAILAALGMISLGARWP